MALSTSSTFYEVDVRTTGNDLNGGAFNWNRGGGGTDRSQQDSPWASGTNLTVDGTTNTDVLPDGYTPVTADVGNVIQISAGTGFTTGFFEITSIVSGKWRLNASPAAAGNSGGTWRMGGALASPGKAAACVPDACDAWSIFIQQGTYLITSATPNVSGGTIQRSAGNWYRSIVGYSSTHRDNAVSGRPVLRASGIASGTILDLVRWIRCVAANLEIDGASLGVSGLVVTTDSTGCCLRNVYQHHTASGVKTQGGTVIDCVINSNTSGNGFDFGAFTALYRCESYASAGYGFVGFGVCIECISDKPTGDRAFDVGQIGVLINCVGGSSNQGSDAAQWIEGHIAWNNVFSHAKITARCGWGRNNATTNGLVSVSGVNISQAVPGGVTLASSPFVNYAGRDYTLASAAPAAMKGLLTLIGSSSTTAKFYADMGVAQRSPGGLLQPADFDGGVG